MTYPRSYSISMRVHRDISSAYKTFNILGLTVSCTTYLQKRCRTKRFYSKGENTSRRTYQCLADLLPLPFVEAVNYLLIFWYLISDGAGEYMELPGKE